MLHVCSQKAPLHHPPVVHSAIVPCACTHICDGPARSSITNGRDCLRVSPMGNVRWSCVAVLLCECMCCKPQKSTESLNKNEKQRQRGTTFTHTNVAGGGRITFADFCYAFVSLETFSLFNIFFLCFWYFDFLFHFCNELCLHFWFAILDGVLCTSPLHRCRCCCCYCCRR